MFQSINDEKIFQTLPGQGWRVLIHWNPDNTDAEDSGKRFPETTLEPVIAWITAKIQRVRKRDGYKYEDVIIAPLVRWPIADELVLLDRYAPENDGCTFVYLAPGEELTQQHFEQLRGAYAREVTVQ